MRGGIKMPLTSLDEITFLRKLQKVKCRLMPITNNKLVDRATANDKKTHDMKRYITEDFDGTYTVHLSPRKSRNYKTFEEAERVLILLHDKESRRLHKWIGNKCIKCGCTKTIIRKGEYHEVFYNGKKERPNCV